ncbi:MAG: hypothetical protein V1717_02190 [Candidatus Micrarchaeota archaeon]
MAPIRGLSLRENARPLVYFTGTIEEARELGLKKIANAFKRAGVEADLHNESHKERLGDFHKTSLDYAEGVCEKPFENPETHFLLLPIPGPEGKRHFAWFKLDRFGENNLRLVQFPSIHDTNAWNVPKLLRSILANDFEGGSQPNVMNRSSRKTFNNFWGTPSIVSLELMAPQTGVTHHPPSGVVRRATESQILRVNVRIPQAIQNDLEAVEKFKESCTSVVRKHGIPISFHE